MAKTIEGSYFLGVVLLCWSLELLAQVSVQQPIVATKDSCAQFNNDISRQLSSLEDQRDQCVRGATSSQLMDRVDAGLCCHEFAGDAANLGWCNTSRLCVQFTKKTYCGYLYRSSEVEKCYERARAGAEIDRLIKPPQGEREEKLSTIRDSVAAIARVQGRSITPKAFRYSWQELVKNNLNVIHNVHQNLLSDFENASDFSTETKPINKVKPIRPKQLAPHGLVNHGEIARYCTSVSKTRAEMMDCVTNSIKRARNGS